MTCGWRLTDTLFSSRSCELFSHLRSAAIAEFTSGKFAALVLSFEFPVYYEYKGEESISEFLFQRITEEQLLEADRSESAISPSEIEELFLIRVSEIRDRAQKFREGEFVSGLTVLIFSSENFDFPTKGLKINPLSFEIPDLKFNIRRESALTPGVYGYIWE